MTTNTPPQQIADMAAKYNAKLVDTTTITHHSKGMVGVHYTYVAILSDIPVLVRMIATPDGRIVSNQLAAIGGKTAREWAKEIA